MRQSAIKNMHISAVQQLFSSHTTAVTQQQSGSVAGIMRIFLLLSNPVDVHNNDGQDTVQQMPL